MTILEKLLFIENHIFANVEFLTLNIPETISFGFIILSKKIALMVLWIKLHTKILHDGSHFMMVQISYQFCHCP
jgi:hypothetical protein